MVLLPITTAILIIEMVMVMVMPTTMAEEVALQSLVKEDAITVLSIVELLWVIAITAADQYED